MDTARLIGYFSDPEISEVAGVAASGANAVAMGQYCIMEHWNDSNAGNPAGSTAQFTGAMQAARQKGLKILLKPIIDCNSYVGDPNTAGWRTAINPTNMAEWIEDYFTKCFAPYLHLVDMVAVHTELGTISSTYPEYMIGLIEQIRLGGFSGPVTTSNDFDPNSSPYWTALDCIGGDAYPTIRTDSKADAVADWSGLAQQAAVAHTQTGCNIIFGELCANLGASMTAAQYEVVYDAFWEVFGPLDYFAGAFLWRWPQNGSTPPGPLMTRYASGRSSYPTCQTPAAAL